MFDFFKNQKSRYYRCFFIMNNNPAIRVHRVATNERIKEIYPASETTAYLEDSSCQTTHDLLEESLKKIPQCKKHAVNIAFRLPDLDEENVLECMCALSDDISNQIKDDNLVNLVVLLKC